VLRAREVSCGAQGGPQVFVQIDGELVGALPVTTEIIPDALTLLVPEAFLVREQSYAAVSVYA
jgi:diacylglycerol kinase family enzyme